MKKKLLSLLVLVALVSSCGTTQKTVSSHKPIVSRVPEKVLTESKRSETYINKEVPETPEELKATAFGEYICHEPAKCMIEIGRASCRERV